MENNFKYVVYQTINIINNKIYIGYHKTLDPFKFDGYIGNGVNIHYPSTYMTPKWPFQMAVKKYGTDKFKRSVLYIFNTEEEALKKEAELVNKDFILRSDTYNLVEGGKLHPIEYISKKIYQFDINGKLRKTDISRAITVALTKPITSPSILFIKPRNGMSDTDLKRCLTIKPAIESTTAAIKNHSTQFNR